MLSPQQIQQFNQATGHSVPLDGSSGPQTSRADEIMNMSNTPDQSQQPGFFSRVGSDLLNRGKAIVSDFKGGFSSGKSPLQSTVQSGRAGLRVAGDIAGGFNDVVAPVLNPVVKTIMSSLPGMDPHMAESIQNNPELQKGLSTVSDWAKGVSAAHPGATKDLSALWNILQAGGTVVGAADLAPGAISAAKEGVSAAGDALGSARSAVGNTISKAKEAISPTLTANEATGRIIQGKLGDIPGAQRTFDSLPSDTGDITKMHPKDLSSAVDKQVQSNLEQVDTHFSNDNTLHPMKDFETTVGKGASEVKTNYVQQAIDQLKAHYSAVNDAQGLSDIKALEAKANAEGLSSQELNNLAKKHGSAINAFNANGQAASGLSKQAAENTRTGVKTTARDTLGKTNPQGAAEATKLDKATSEAIHTKDLLDKQVEAGNKSVQKHGKENIFQRAQRSIKANPIKSAVGGYVADKAIKKTTGIGF